MLRTRFEISCVCYFITSIADKHPRQHDKLPRVLIHYSCFSSQHENEKGKFIKIINFPIRFTTTTWFIYAFWHISKFFAENISAARWMLISQKHKVSSLFKRGDIQNLERNFVEVTLVHFSIFSIAAVLLPFENFHSFLKFQFTNITFGPRSRYCKILL